MTAKDQIIWAEMARRKKKFHPDEEWNKIKLWGLFQWGMVSHLLKSGDLITDMKKEHKTIWVTPSPEAYAKYIQPLLKHRIETLTKMAGWD
jgi:hypothetical protein